MRRGLPLCLVTLVLGCGAERELDRFCDVATQVLADESVPEELAMQTIVDRYGTPRNLEVLEILQLAATLPADMRVEGMKSMAANSGVEDWSCPALDELWREEAEAARKARAEAEAAATAEPEPEPEI